MKKQLSGIVAAALVVSATAAFGAVKEGQFSISPVVGGYTFDHRQDLETSMVYGIRGGYNFTKRFGIEALFDYANSKPDNAPKKDVGMFRYGGELLYHMWPDNNFVPYLAAGYSAMNIKGDVYGNKQRGAFDYGLGAKYFLNDSFALRGDVRHILYSISDRFNNNFEYTLGAYIPFGGAAPAVQPVAMPVVAPVVPPPAPMPEPAKIVPPAPVAPTANLSVSPVTIVKTNDAAATLSWASSNADKCSIQPGIGSVETQGSRSISPSVDTAYTLTCSGPGGEATSSANLGVTLPPPPAPVVTPKQAAAIERFCNKPAVVTVLFDTDKSEIKPKYLDDLNSLGEFLKDFPKAKGEISGHTDNVGSAKYNLKLSQRRAEAVEKYIEKTFAVVSDRVTTKGFGETKPVASNKTKEGRQLNRRIETNFTCE
ncbi:MAG: outer membrane beta-barrel domain-containing protein [Geobacter sp.]|nr:outer membrane beta-barrel domain-containing protein [Geobacter sp.]